MSRGCNLLSRFAEFFEVNRSYSMRNLTVFITIIVASVIVLYLAARVNNAGETRLSAEMFIAYLLAGGGVYSFGKWQDDRTKRTEIDAASDQPPASAASVTINQPEKVNLSP